MPKFSDSKTLEAEDDCVDVKLQCYLRPTSILPKETIPQSSLQYSGIFLGDYREICKVQCDVHCGSYAIRQEVD